MFDKKCFSENVICSCCLQIDDIKAKGGEEASNVDELLSQQGQLIEEIFSHDDKDKDGYISHEEFSGPKHDEL